MTVYNDMACDAGYPFGSDENEQMAGMIESNRAQEYQEYQEWCEEEHFLQMVGEWLDKNCRCWLDADKQYRKEKP